MRRSDQVLVFDADDTLWENNVLFERVIEAFLTWVAHPGLDRAAARAVLDDIERANAVTLGYGAEVFLRSLAECAAKVRGRPVTAGERTDIRDMARPLTDRQVELMPDVAETLADLSTRHRLLMLTKGAPEEQRAKIEASSIAHHFGAVEIVREKDADTYLRLIGAHGISPEMGWMIGNSPKSDILPARAAGLNAVFIPHPHTWVLEHGEVDPADDGVLHLSAFAQLTEHF